MATASYTLAPGYVLTGTTSGAQQAPINYSINGTSVGRAIDTNLGGGFTYSYYVNADDKTYTLKVNDVTIAMSLSQGTVTTIASNLRNGTNSINNAITRQVEVATPAPAPTVTKVTATSTSTTVTSTKNSTTNVTTQTTKITTPPATKDPSTVTTTAATAAKKVATPPVPVDPAKALQDEKAKKDLLSPTQLANAPAAQGAAKGLTGAQQKAASSATDQDQKNSAAQNNDWRIKLQLASNAQYFYKIAEATDIMYPLKITDGVIFPYVPSITVSYAAGYEPTQLTHTNYKVYQYQSSGVDQIQINCDFTAQDPVEAAYVLSVIHFFRSMTKMFYGQDTNPKNGTPPPLCFISGMGGYQFDKLPLAISSFNYSLPTDVDYVKTTGIQPAGTPKGATTGATSPSAVSANRLSQVGINSSGKKLSDYSVNNQTAGTPATWVPSRINLSITCVPIMSRNNVSNNFSLHDYASGKLLLGSTNGKGGFW